MSRTVRRRKDKWKFFQVVGTFEEFIRPHHNPEIITWEVVQSRKSGVSLEQMYQDRVAWFYRDTDSGRRSAPREFRRLYGSKYSRTVNSKDLHTHNKYDSWEQHSSEPYPRNAGWYWF